ncbi:MAG: AAA family ATPase [Caldilineaceae bacterium SB0666_bin_21]|nr:AAA family ATPase [Caldilineaceae bacterium SB0666_bin_21]
MPADHGAPGPTACGSGPNRTSAHSIAWDGTAPHPSQKRLVDRDWNGPVRVLGGAGTGKTVVTMLRAKWLARHRARVADGKVLFLTFTANLAADLRRSLEDLIRAEVIHLDQWIYRFLNQHNFPQLSKHHFNVLSTSPSVGTPGIPGRRGKPERLSEARIPPHARSVAPVIRLHPIPLWMLLVHLGGRPQGSDPSRMAM